MTRPYSTWEKPRPPYSAGIFMPKAPSRFSPSTTSFGYSPVASISPGLTRSRRKARSLSKNAVNSGRSLVASGIGRMRCIWRFPRKISFRKLGSFHSACRAASATRRDSRSLSVWIVREALMGNLGRLI